MFAIFQTGGKQYKVQVNDVIYAEKLEAKEKEEITFSEVLMVDDKIGTPFVKGAKVVCEVEKLGKQSKMVIIKHISQKHHTKTQGHRQPYIKLVVRKIIL